MKPSGKYEVTLRLDTGERFIIRESFENLSRKFNVTMNIQGFETFTQIVDDNETEEGEKENV